MGKILRRLKLGKKNKLVFEAALAVLFIIIFIGVLGGITATYRTPILSTKDLLDSKVWIEYYAYNTTTGTYTFAAVMEYNLSDIATFYNNALYISIPYDVQLPSGYDYAVFSALIIPLNKTYSQLIDQGLNFIEINMSVFDNNIVKKMDISAYLSVYPSTDTIRWYASTDAILLIGTINTTSGILNTTVNVDLGRLVLEVTQHNIGNKQAYLIIQYKISRISGIKLHLNMYAVSEKPILRALTEPVYSVIAGLYAAFLAAVNRVKQYVMSAAAGFTASFTFTGLIGDPVVALVVTIIIVTVVFILIKKK